MKFKLAISPCPNDTFMFHGLLHENIIKGDLNPEVVFADIEELNKMAIAEEADVCKLSYNAYPAVQETYEILDSGSALGQNCGPLLIAKNEIQFSDLSTASTAIPGWNTTAHFLLNFAFPQITKKTELIFSEIENSVLSGEYDCGVIIHENRFTYQEKGLLKIKDLGEHWETNTGHPIPLGCIAIKRSLPAGLKHKINQALYNSILHGFNKPDASREFVMSHAQEMDLKVMQNHINLYVNEYSLSLGEKGKNAVRTLFKEKMKQENHFFSLDKAFLNNS